MPSIHHGSIGLLALFLPLTACSETDQANSIREGSASLEIRGEFRGSASPESTTLRAVIVWTYWDPSDCESAGTPGELGFSQSCSGSWYPTDATLVGVEGTFTLEILEPPPAFVHGFDSEMAEGFITVIPENADISQLDLTSGEDTLGVSESLVVIFAREDFEADTLEAAMVGGPVGAGFHLVKPILGPQYNVVLDNGNEVISHQRGEILSDLSTPVVIQDGIIPSLGL